MMFEFLQTFVPPWLPHLFFLVFRGQPRGTLDPNISPWANAPHPKGDFSLSDLGLADGFPEGCGYAPFPTPLDTVLCPFFPRVICFTRLPLGTPSGGTFLPPLPGFLFSSPPPCLRPCSRLSGKMGPKLWFSPWIKMPPPQVLTWAFPPGIMGGRRFPQTSVEGGSALTDGMSSFCLRPGSWVGDMSPVWNPFQEKTPKATPVNRCVQPFSQIAPPPPPLVLTQNKPPIFHPPPPEDFCQQKSLLPPPPLLSPPGFGMGHYLYTIPPPRIFVMNPHLLSSFGGPGFPV